MEIRKITQEERIHYDAINYECFVGMKGRDIREQMRNPSESKDEGWERAPVWAAFEGGKMLSAMTVHNYTIRMNGHNVQMGGIGGVVTKPESRGKGYVRRIMRPVFDEMRELGQVYSFLYPFSYAYYRMFGYEMAFPRHTTTIPVREFAKFPYPERFVPYEPNDPIEPYAQIYAEFIKNRNLAVVRDERTWKRMLQRDPYLKRDFTFLNYAPDGKPNAYVLYKAVNKGSAHNTLSVRELCWTDPAGLHAVFGFFGKLSAEYRDVEWNVPDGISMQALMPDCYAISVATHAVGMNRIVDVPAVLAMQPAPAGSAVLSIGVTDAFCPENTGLYRIEWQGGKLNVTRHAESFTNADMETNVTTLAQLTTGYITAAEAQYRVDTVIRDKKQELALLFPKKDLYLLEGF
ncbi:MAG: GNAT family N-acetyltransferase [Defluviitaleaceae bacterium]|nr:GNAT family N-acetyltransferase [Defluviitaleaceae bacterium]